MAVTIQEDIDVVNPVGTGQVLPPTYILLVVSMIFNAMANFLIKVAMTGKEVQLGSSHLGDTFKMLAFNPVLWGGVLLFGVALLGYSIVLSRMNLSTAYPAMAGGGFLLVFILSAFYLKETITLSHLGGALAIILGMWLMLK